MAKKIFISPSNQTRNLYAYGNTTEAIQCGKIGVALQAALERCGRCRGEMRRLYLARGGGNDYNEKKRRGRGRRV